LKSDGILAAIGKKEITVVAHINAKERKTSKKRKKSQSLSDLEKKLDKVFSQYIRLKGADAGGTVECVTCNQLFYWKETDCGHFIKRQYRSVRWDERNVGVQCTRCNHYMGGRQDDYSRYIIKTYGYLVFDELMRLKYQTMKFTKLDIQQKIDEYKEKLECLNVGRD
jgi:5-methylcytosine-specific restriction endonuclease McrA